MYNLISLINTYSCVSIITVKIKNILSFLLLFSPSPIGKHSFAFSQHKLVLSVLGLPINTNLSSVYSFMSNFFCPMLCFPGSFIFFNVSVVFWVYGICKLIFFFTKCGNFLAIISNIFFLSISPSCIFWNSNCMWLDDMILPLKLCLFLSYFLFSSEWISIDTPSSSLTFYSPICFCIHPVKVLLQVLLFSVLKFPFSYFL